MVQWRGRGRAGRAAAAVGLALGLLACGDEAPATTPVGSAGGGGSGGEGGTGGGAVCAPGEVPLGDGSCRPAGVASCGEGFEPDGADGCDAVLPEAPCAPGTMAVPGESSCRPVAPCGDGTWGEIPVEDDSQFVDGSYEGSDSDGSQTRPWTNIQQGVDAAVAGAIVAVAAGSYAENVVVTGKAVRLWGRCPEQVEIVGQGGSIGTLEIVVAAHGTQVRDLAIAGPGIGVFVTAAQDVVLERVWIHDVEGRGVNAQDTGDGTSITVRDSLVESARDIGVFSSGATVSLDRSVVRATRTTTELEFGRGVASQARATGRAAVTLRQSLIAQSQDLGVYAAGTDLVVESTVVRDTRSVGQLGTGRGMGIQYHPPTEERSVAVVGSSLIVGNRAYGMFISGSEVTVEDTVVRDTAPTHDEDGMGISVQADSGTGITSQATVQSSVVERNSWVGVAVSGSALTLEGTVIRDTLPGLEWGGAGLSISYSLNHGAPATGEVRHSVLARNPRVQLMVNGSDAALQGTVVRESPAIAGETWGRGIQVQVDATTETPSVGTIESCLVEDAYDLGLAIVGSDVAVSASTVRRTMPQPPTGLFGDGLAVVSEFVPASVALTDVRIGDNARAGLSAFGAHIDLGTTAMACNLIDLAGADHHGFPFSLADLGGNECGCEAMGSCTVATSGLEPPSAVGEP